MSLGQHTPKLKKKLLAEIDKMYPESNIKLDDKTKKKAPSPIDMHV